MRSTAAKGIALRFCDAAPSVGEPAMRRPSSSNSVYCEPMPRSDTVACDCAELARDHRDRRRALDVDALDARAGDFDAVERAGLVGVVLRERGNGEQGGQTRRAQLERAADRGS